MIRAIKRQASIAWFILGFLIIGVALLYLSITPRRAVAEVPVCHAAMVIDRSGSVGQDNLDTLEAQIQRLFQPPGTQSDGTSGGLYTDKIQLAFWSFSALTTTDSRNAATNYDGPWYHFVSSKGGNIGGFNTALSSIPPGGATNYEQGFGYDGYAEDNQVINTHEGIDATINQADIIVFMTDGAPNLPQYHKDSSQPGDNNVYARAAARQAALRHLSRGKLIVGGLVGSTDSGSLDYVINGYNGATRANPPNIFRISTDYSDLTHLLSVIIAQKCNELIPPTPPVNYTLTPTVTSNDRVASGATTASFSYNVNNTIPAGSSDSTGWSIKQIVVPKGQSADPLSFGNQPYQDNFSCQKEKDLLSGNMTSCNDVTTNTRTFGVGNTSLDAEAGAGKTIVIDDTWPIGTKICYVLVINQPTQDSSPTDRYSKAACLTIGKRPSMQVHGGDVRVGRNFAGSVDPSQPSEINTSVTAKSDGKSYGSWGEYGAFAPGAITGFATASGLSGGYDSIDPNAQQFWSKLTFANTENQFGYFTATNQGQGVIPEYAGAILASQTGGTGKDLSTTSNLVLQSGTNVSGIYKKDSGDLTIGDITHDNSLGKNETVVISVPNGTVTIAGNITYGDGPYQNMSEIPQLVIIAKTIVIKPNVLHVDSWLIANNATDGTVSTCDDPAILTISVCNQPLAINGPIIAHHLSLRRTGGAGAGPASGDSAEIINLPGTTYLWSQVKGQSDVRAQTTFTTELPPYF